MNKKKRNKILIIASSIFLGIIFLMLTLYFITSYYDGNRNKKRHLIHR